MSLKDFYQTWIAYRRRWTRSWKRENLWFSERWPIKRKSRKNVMEQPFYPSVAGLTARSGETAGGNRRAGRAPARNVHSRATGWTIWTDGILSQLTLLARTLEYNHRERIPRPYVICAVVQIVPEWCTTHCLNRPIVTNVVIKSCRCDRKTGPMETLITWARLQSEAPN